MVRGIHWKVVPRLKVIHIGKEISMIDRIEDVGKHRGDALLRSPEINLPAELGCLALIDERIAIEEPKKVYS
jgi:hypothetical protein